MTLVQIAVIVGCVVLFVGLCICVHMTRYLAWPGAQITRIAPCASESGKCATLRVPGDPSQQLQLELHTPFPSYAAVYNPSCAYISVDGAQTPELITATRISSYTFCPGANISQHYAQQFDGIGVTWMGRAFQVHIPDAWFDERAAHEWQASGGSGEYGPALSVSKKKDIMRQWRIEDPRVFELASGVLGLLTSISTNDQHCIRMVLLVVRLPRAPTESSLLTPQSVILFPVQGGNTKNWMARVSNERIYLIVHVQPQTTLSLSLEDVLHASKMVVLQPRVDLENDTSAGVPPGWRGNTSLVPSTIGGRPQFIAIVHLKHNDPVQWGRWGIKAWGAMFEHAFARFDVEPPFRVRAVSRSFRIEPQMPLGAPSQFVFCTGLALIPETSQGLVTFGVDDCYEASCVFEHDEIELLFDAASTATVVKHVVVHA